MKNTLILLMVFILTLLGVSALTCEYDNEPFLQNRIKWVCTLNTTDDCECISYVEGGDGLLAVYPNEKIIEDVGRIDYYRSNNKLVNIYFSDVNIYPLQNYTFGVKCASTEKHYSEEFSASVVPVYKEVFEVAYRAVWIKENTGYLIAIFLLIIIIVAIAVFIWRSVYS